MNHNIEIKKSDDGSNTLYNKELDLHYHSTYGAISESNLVFINNGLLEILKNYKSIKILEVGFGSGLNFLLTLKNIINTDYILDYVGVEAFPIGINTAKTLNYNDFINLPNYYKIIEEIHSEKSFENKSISKNINLSVICDKIQNINNLASGINLVYFDAFDYAAQPEMWSKEVFSMISNKMVKNGILVTYSCKREVKQNLISSGFSIEKLKGPIGKREVLRAWKN